MQVTVIHDANIGNSPSTTYKAFAERSWAVAVNGVLCRDSKGRVRRFASPTAAYLAGRQIAADRLAPVREV